MLVDGTACSKDPWQSYGSGRIGASPPICPCPGNLRQGMTALTALRNPDYGAPDNPEST